MPVGETWPEPLAVLVIYLSVTVIPLPEASRKA